MGMFDGEIRGSKRDPIPGTQYQWLTDNCPRCSGALYEMEKCCGAPEGLIECSRCDWSEVPTKYYNRGE